MEPKILLPIETLLYLSKYEDIRFDDPFLWNVHKRELTLQPHIINECTTSPVLEPYLRLEWNKDMHFSLFRTQLKFFGVTISKFNILFVLGTFSEVTVKKRTSETGCR